MRILRQTVGIGKMRMNRAKLCRPTIHQLNKLRRASRDMLRDGDGSVVAAGEHQPQKHLPKRQRFALRQIDGRSRHAEGARRTGHPTFRIAQLQRQKCRHDLRCRSHRQTRVHVVFKQHAPCFYLHDAGGFCAGLSLR